MSQEITLNEYKRSKDRVRETRDLAYQIARISGIMFAIFGTVTIFTRLGGGEIPAFPKFTFIAGFAILAVFGIMLPVIFVYMYQKPLQELLVDSLRLARQGVITDDFLYELMIWCTRQNRVTVRVFEWLMGRIVVPAISWGVSLILAAVVWLYL